jgi:Polyketide cyclase / dehydrase and lipid transport
VVMKWAIIAGLALVAVIVLVVVIGLLLPQGHVVARRARFKQPPEVIWETISGPPSWRPDVKSYEMLPEPAGRMQWREVDSHGQSILFERVEAHPPQRLVTRIADPKLPFGGSWTHEIVPTGDGCVLTITERGEVYNPVFRFMSRFVFGHTATLEKYLAALGKNHGEEVVVEE